MGQLNAAIVSPQFRSLATRLACSVLLGFGGACGSDPAANPAATAGFGGTFGGTGFGAAGVEALGAAGSGTGFAGTSGFPTAGAGGESGASGAVGLPTAGSGGAGGESGAGGASGAGGSGGAAGMIAEPSCLDGITDYEKDGPFTSMAMTSGMVKLWIPAVPAGCKVPVIHLANGTGGTCNTYAAILRRLASHGFLATCYESPQTGQGTQCVTALELAFTMFPDLADNKIGSTGHSQGGGAAFTCLQRAEEKWGTAKIYTGLAMEPASGYGDSPANWAEMYGKIKSPMFMFNGTSDTLVSSSWVKQAFDAMSSTNETYWYAAIGATHVPVPTAATQQVAVPWFRWKLLGDKAACEYFKAMPNGDKWDLKESQNEVACN